MPEIIESELAPNVKALWLKAITATKNGVRYFEVMEDECVGCTLCVNVCPVDSCITMIGLEAGVLDQRTGQPVSPVYANWTTHPNNPMAKQAAGQAAE